MIHIFSLFSDYYHKENPSIRSPLPSSHSDSPNMSISPSILNARSNTCQVDSFGLSSKSQKEIAKLISTIFGFVPGSSISSLGFERQERVYLHAFPSNEQFTEVSDTPGFIKELLSYENRPYLWSNVSKLPKDLYIPKGISIYILTTSTVEELRFEDIHGMVIHQISQLCELPPPIKEFLSSIICHKGLRHLKVFVLINVFLDRCWLTGSMKLDNLGLLCLENCAFNNPEILKEFASIDRLYLIPKAYRKDSIFLPESLAHLNIFCPEPEKSNYLHPFLVSARGCQKLETM